MRLTTAFSLVLSLLGLSVDAGCVSFNATAPDKLPYNLIPDSYLLDITLPAPGASEAFSGVVRIQGTLQHSTTCLVLHAGTGMTVSQALANTLPASVRAQRENQTVVLTFATELAAGPVELSLSYNGTINTADATGLFLSPNTVAEGDEDAGSSVDLLKGRKRAAGVEGRERRERRHAQLLARARTRGDPMMFATQFEEEYARTMFPCVDEPGYKSVFRANFTVPAGLTVFFNTPESGAPRPASSAPSQTVFTFQQTMNPLPTYLVAVAVGTFDTLERTSNGVLYRIITPVGKKDWATLALNASIHAAEFFGKSYGLPYSVMNSKMDSISVRALDMDAMENQGLLTYSSQMLLLDPNPNATTPMPLTEGGRLAQAQLITLVTTHEIAHQWFGDTVTMRDWVQEYLNEGFARILQAYGVDDLVPEWDMMCYTGETLGRSNSFFQFSYEKAMTFDTPGTAPAICYPLPGGGDIPPFPSKETETASASVSASAALDPAKAPLFSRIFYEKGASVNRMVGSHIGWAAWNEATGAHASRFRWQNPTVEDLMRSLGPAFLDVQSPHPLTSMLPWLQRPGYPVVTLAAELVAGSLQSSPPSLKVTVSQAAVSKYLPSDRAHEPWWVPMMVDATVTVSCGDTELTSATQTFLAEFNTSSAMFTVPLSPALTALLHPIPSCAATPAAADLVVVGNPRFLGPFVVRYDDKTQWDARVAAVSSLSTSASGEATPRDYVRETIFHATLLTKMSLEPVTLLAEMLAGVASPLGEFPTLGGVLGSGDFYDFVLQMGDYVGHFEVTDKILSPSFRAVLSPLLARLGWPSSTSGIPAMTTNGQNNPHPEKMGGDVPWPTHEDPGVEERAKASLWPVALYRGVLYNDAKTVDQALAAFREAASSLSFAPLPSIAVQAVFFAAGRYGTDEDHTNLLAVYHALSPSDPNHAFALAGLTAGAGTMARCHTGVDIITALGDMEARIATLGQMLTLAPLCADAALVELSTQAEMAWSVLGNGATSMIQVALAGLSTPEHLATVHKLVAGQNATVVSPEDVAGIITPIQINIDFIHANTP